jgi:hypothetical protein
MSVSLQDSQGKILEVNAWNWGMLHFVVTCSTIPLFDNETLENLRYGGIELLDREIRVLHDFLEAVVLPRIESGHRMLSDLSVTNEPDDGTFHRDDLSKNYSLHHDVLVQVIDFLANAKTPISIF